MSANIDIEQAGSTVAEVRMFISNLLKNQNQFSQSDIAEINAIMKLRSARQMKNKFKELLERIDSNSLTFYDEDEIDPSINNEPEEEHEKPKYVCKTMQEMHLMEAKVNWNNPKTLLEWCEGNPFDFRIKHLEVGKPLIDCYYLKCHGTSSEKARYIDIKFLTGHQLDISKCPGLIVVDIDFDKLVSEHIHNAASQAMAKKILPLIQGKTVVVLSRSNSLHIYCVYDFEENEYGFWRNSNVSIAHGEINGVKYDIDFKVSLFHDKSEFITLPGTRADNKYGKIGTYEIISGNLNTKITLTVQDCLDAIGIGLVHQHKPSNDEIDTRINRYSDEYIISHWPMNFQRSLFNGLSGIDIHRTSHGKPMKEIVSLYRLFTSINCLHSSIREEAKEFAYNHCTLTAHALQAWNENKEETEGCQTDISWLMSIVKNHNKAYYEEDVVPTMPESIRKPPIRQEFNMFDEFDMDSFAKLAKRGYYRTERQAAMDMSKFLLYCRNTSKPFYLRKIYDTTMESWKFSYQLPEVLHTDLGKINVLYKYITNEDEHVKKKVCVTALDILNKYREELVIKGIKFHSTKKNIINRWPGFPWKELKDKTDEEIEKYLEDYLDLVENGLCFGNKDLTLKTHQIIAYKVQYPDKLLPLSMVIKTPVMGSGKNTWSDTICKLFKGASNPTINSIEQIVGKYNSGIEHMCIIVVNEMKAFGNQDPIDALKGYVSDALVRIGQKYEVDRISENVAFYIFISNNAKPLSISPGDRRYVVYEMSDKFVGDYDFFARLHDQDDEFFDYLFTYYKRLSLNGFSPYKKIPTAAGNAIIKASMSHTEKWILHNFSDIQIGMRIGDIKSKFKSFKETHSFTKTEEQFILELTGYCVKNQKGEANRTSFQDKNGTITKGYKLTQYYIDIFKHLVDDDAEEEPTNEEKLKTLEKENERMKTLISENEEEIKKLKISIN